jgi:hypothetical protein
MDFELDYLWELYPRKIKRTLGMKKLSKIVTSDKVYNDLENAITCYANHVKHTEKQYIMHFTTFLSSWSDWIDFEEEEIKHVVDISKLRAVK